MRRQKEIFASNDGQFVAPSTRRPSLSPTPPSPTPGLSRTPSPSPFNPTSRRTPLPPPAYLHAVALLLRRPPSPCSSSSSSFDDQLVPPAPRRRVHPLHRLRRVPQRRAVPLHLPLLRRGPAGPGYLYYCAPPPSPAAARPPALLPRLAHQDGGRQGHRHLPERARCAHVPVDRCLSIIGKHSMLNVEAKGRGDARRVDQDAARRHDCASSRPRRERQGEERWGRAEWRAAGGAGGAVGRAHRRWARLLPPPRPPHALALSPTPCSTPPRPPLPSPSPHSACPLPSLPVTSCRLPTLFPSPVRPVPPPPSASLLAGAGSGVPVHSRTRSRCTPPHPPASPSIVDVSIFFQPLPHTSPDAPGALFWVPVGAQARD